MKDGRPKVDNNDKLLNNNEQLQRKKTKPLKLISVYKINYNHT